LIEGDGDRGVAIPEKIKFFKKGDKVETKPSIAGDIGIDDVEKSPFEEVGKVLAK
jgi:hypothetical protein